MSPNEDKFAENQTPDSQLDSTSGSDTAPTDQSDEPTSQDAPVDALSRTPEDLSEEQESATADASSDAANTQTDQPASKKPSAVKRFFKKANLYFLMFILLAVVAGAIAIVSYLNSSNEPAEPAIATQEMTPEALQQLANTDASVGSASQTLTIQGNAVIEGQTLMRGNLNVAGNFQTGGSIQGSELTIPGSASLGEAQINSLQVASNTAIQGNTTLRDLNVAGAASFSGAVTASQLTVTRLILSGNAELEVPNHIRFSGPSPNRGDINGNVLGSGGSASVSGSDTTGTVNISTGNNPSAGCFVRINFNRQFSNRPHVIISPVGPGAGATQHYVDRNQSGFSICTSAPAPANQSFAFDYFVTN